MKKKIKSLHYPKISFKYNTKIISKSSDARIYTDCILLTEGEYSDSIGRQPVVYSQYELSKAVKNWESNYLNLDHSFEVLKRLGFIKNPHLGKNGEILGDLYIFPITQTARDTIALIDNGLINWLSVELTSEDTWDSIVCKRNATDIRFIGAAIVTYPADSNTRVIKDGPAPK